MPCKRRADWETRLRRQLQSDVEAPFSWGENDCVLFLRRAIMAQTGVEVPLGVSWSDRRSARQLVEQQKLSERVAAALAAAGIEEIPPLFAQRGDAVIVQIPGFWDETAEPTECCGLVDWSGSHVTCLGLRGPVRVPLTRVIRAWRL